MTVLAPYFDIAYTKANSVMYQQEGRSDAGVAVCCQEYDPYFLYLSLHWHCVWHADERSLFSLPISSLALRLAC